MPDIIHSITHIGPKLNFLLIILHKDSQGWLFRLVDDQGTILQEQIGKENAIAAEQEGRQWLADYQR